MGRKTQESTSPAVCTSGNPVRKLNSVFLFEYPHLNPTTQNQ